MKNMFEYQNILTTKTNCTSANFLKEVKNQLPMYLKPNTNAINFSRLAYSIILAMLTAAMMASCVTTKNTDYFQTLSRDTTLNNFVTNDFENKIQAGDILAMKATSLNAVEDGIFNQGGAEMGSTGSGAGNPGFLVKQNGKISLHRLGEVQAAGFTRREFAAQIKDQLQPFMKDVLVSVIFLNHKITVLGAVGAPTVIPLQTEQLPLIDALVLSGGVTEKGKKNDVMVIREEGNQKKVKHLNLEDASIFGSEWYYARPNDIIYIKTDQEAAIKAEKRNSLQSSLALVASGIGLLLIIIDRIIK